MGWFSPGASVCTTQAILKANTNVKFQDPEKMLVTALPKATLGRVHSVSKNGVFTIWFYEETYGLTIIADIPQDVVGLFVKPHPHKMFPHFAN